MQQYVCDLCGYVYVPEDGDPDAGVAPGTAWEDVPENWVCPLCGAHKDDFSPI
ncbi:MAG: rubredoxin [Clostridiaceae bacterium]|nr:rubredoxin [Clostridiaceae bacterium]